MFKFADQYPPGPNKYLCEGWCCGYAPSPCSLSELPDALSEEQLKQINDLCKTKVFSKCYFETLDEIYEALDFELQHCISTHKVRTAEGEFSFKGKRYRFSRVFDFSLDEAWIEITDTEGNVLFGRGN